MLRHLRDVAVARAAKRTGDALGSGAMRPAGLASVGSSLFAK